MADSVYDVYEEMGAVVEYGSNFSAVMKPEIWSWDPGQGRQNRGL